MVKNKDILVIKRDGTKTLFDVTKIKQSIAFATDGQGVDPLHLEASLDQFVKNGITTSEIQDNVIRHAVQLASPQNPEWLNVAGRALAMQMWADFSLRGKTFYEIIKYNIRKNEYTSVLLDFYSKEDIEILGKYIIQDRDLNHSHSSLITVSKKYLGKYELNQHMHMVNAMRFGQMESAEIRVNFVKELYDMLSLRKISLATPFMSNLRKGGNTASCFIIALEDDLDSIFNNVKRIARISKNGGGLGIFLGLLRAKGSAIGSVENAAGSITQWVKIINDTLVAVNQNGKRKGAGTVALPIWHNDIFDFLDMQTEHGDIRLKSYDVFPQITVPDIFMERDKQNGKWTTFCPFEVKQKLNIDIRGLYGDEFTEVYLKIEDAHVAGKLKVSNQYNARDLFKTFMKTQFETGLPYIAFTDTINASNPNAGHADSLGITNVNLCTESFSNVMPDKLGHVCNLCSINLSNIDSMEELAKASRMSALMLDYGIELTNNPDDITLTHNSEFRTIGIGQMGLHDYLAKNWKNFSDLETIRDISECIEYNAALQSVEISKLCGPFKAFAGSKWANGEMTSMFIANGGKLDWKYLQSQIDLYGIRNSQLTSPAPTTSTSIYQDCSASILPIYSAFFSEDNKNGSLLVAAKFLSLNPLGYGKTFAKHSAIEIIDSTSESQKFIDTGVSMELIFDQNKESFSAKDLYDAVHYAHVKKIKAVYYIRSIKKNSTLENKEDACVACSG
jgi:ribonucleoside-diphosphate reductase alpha chain